MMGNNWEIDETRELLGYPIVEDLLELLQASLEADAKLPVMKALTTIAGQGFKK